MCKAIDDMIEDGRAEGRIEGERRGRIDGEQQGIALTKRVFKLSREGKSIQEIAEMCEISTKKVQLILE